MTVRLVHAQCANCGTLGPDADSVPGARLKAGDNGWLITTRRTDKRDYCPKCRPQFEPAMCAVPHVDNTTGMAVYRITGDGRTVHACGMHSQKLQREMFAGGSNPLTVTQILVPDQNHAPYTPKRSLR